MNVVDSSGWLEYFADDANAAFFAPAILDVEHLLVPTLSLLEVFKRILQQRGDGDALQAVALMRQGTIVDLDADLALAAARVGALHGLALADSVIYASALQRGSVLWTQDADFEGLPQVRYVAKLRLHDG
ncbi:MAG: type II toxin-antitoxin system VapC family toxin [bacterium]